MSGERPEIRKEVHTPAQPADSGNLAEAVKWVYERYGTDLSKFFQDAYKDVARKNREAAEANVEDYAL